MAELLISATAANTQQVGEVVDSRDSPFDSWGLCQPPNYIHLTISDDDRAGQAKHFKEWITFYEHVLQSENAQRFRFRTNVHPQAVSASGEGAVDDFDDIMDWAERVYNATLISTSPTQMLYDLPKPVDVDQYFSDLADLFDHQHDPREFFLAQSFVDQALANGGKLALTNAEADAAFTDKLDL